MNRLGRPFGVAIAIVAGTFLFALLPLLQVGMVLVLQQRFLDISVGGSQPDLLASGSDLPAGVTSEQLLLQSGLALAFLVIAVASAVGALPNEGSGLTVDFPQRRGRSPAPRNREMVENLRDPLPHILLDLPKTHDAYLQRLSATERQNVRTDNRRLTSGHEFACTDLAAGGHCWCGNRLA